MPSKQSRKNRKKTAGRRAARWMQSERLEPHETPRFTEISREGSETPVGNTDASLLINDEDSDLEVGSSESIINSQR